MAEVKARVVSINLGKRMEIFLRKDVVVELRTLNVIEYITLSQTYKQIFYIRYYGMIVLFLDVCILI